MSERYRGVPSSLAGRLLARDWRSGEVLVLLAALAIAVGAMSAVTFFTDRVRQAVSQQAGESLAADLRVESSRPLPEGLAAAGQKAGLATAAVVSFRSVVLARDQSALADIRGVSAAYPLRGRVQVADALAAAPRDAAGTPPAWRGMGRAQPPRAAERLGRRRDRRRYFAPTDHEDARVRPDQGWRFIEIAPTVLLNLDDVYAAGLLGAAASRSTTSCSPAARAQSRNSAPGLPSSCARVIRCGTIGDGRPEVRAAIRNAERFLVLAALVSVLLGGVAVAIAARRFVARRLDAVAVMKCLGARYRDVLRLNLLQLLLLVAAAAVIGCLGGLAQFGLTALLGDFVEGGLPAQRVRRRARPASALAVAVGSALPPLLQLGRVPPARVAASDLDPPPLRYLTIYGVAALAVTALLYVLFGDLELIGVSLRRRGRDVRCALSGRQAARAAAAARSRARRRGVALWDRERRASRTREQRPGRRVRHRVDGAAAADVRAYAAHEPMAGDAARSPRRTTS